MARYSFNTLTPFAILKMLTKEKHISRQGMDRSTCYMYKNNLLNFSPIFSEPEARLWLACWTETQLSSDPFRQEYFLQYDKNYHLDRGQSTLTIKSHSQFRLWLAIKVQIA